MDTWLRLHGVNRLVCLAGHHLSGLWDVRLFRHEIGFQMQLTWQGPEERIRGLSKLIHQDEDLLRWKMV